MRNVDFSKFAQANQNTQSVVEGNFDPRGSSRRSQEEREFTPALGWINVGIVVEIEDPQTGEVREEFLTLGGIPMDVLEKSLARIKIPAPNGGSNEDYRQMMIGRKNLMEQALEFLNSMPWGSSKITEKLGVQFLKVKDPSQNNLTPSADNPYVNKIDF